MQDDEPSGPIVHDSRLDDIFFAKQVINNACATQAILSLLLNCKHPDLSLGSTLTDLHEFCQSFDPYTKGLTLSNASHIRSVHNSFARQTLFELDNKVRVCKSIYGSVVYASFLYEFFRSYRVKTKMKMSSISLATCQSTVVSTSWMA